MDFEETLVFSVPILFPAWRFDLPTLGMESADSKLHTVPEEGGGPWKILILRAMFPRCVLRIPGLTPGGSMSCM